MPDGLGRFRNAVPPTSDERSTKDDAAPTTPTEASTVPPTLSQPTDVLDGLAVAGLDAPPSHSEERNERTLIEDSTTLGESGSPFVLPDGVNGADPAAMALALIPDTDLMAGAPAATSDERKTVVEDESIVPSGDVLDPQVSAGLSALYGDDFPLLKQHAGPQDWASWPTSLWGRHRSGVQSRLHLVERNRHFRDDNQWISSNGLGPWREPPKPRDAARIVDNMIAPALEQRVNLVIEQRPGFRTRPASGDADDVKKAEAGQAALEYQWEQQKMGGANSVSQEAAYWAGTDGVSFLETYWNPDAGPWHETEEMQDGAGTQLAPSSSGPLGDAKTRVRRIEQVRVSAEATATQRPWYWIIRETIPTAQAVKEHGPGVLTGLSQGYGGSADPDRGTLTGGRIVGGYLLPDVDEMVKDQPTTDRYTVYCDKSEFLKQGLQLTVVGQQVVAGPMPLLTGVVPMARWTDGSADPAFYPTPLMDRWISVQQRQNALWSKWIEGIRKMSGVNLLARKGSIAQDTLKGGVMNIINVEGASNLNDVVKEIGAQSMSSDLKEALAANQARFEHLSGWSDASRGSFNAGESGRSILAQREVLERIFAPPITAAADAMTVWAKNTLAFMRWGYDLPRTIAVEGKGRTDLGRALHADDLDGVTDVFIDAETLMPMPKALKLFMLDQMLDKQLISPEEYRRRQPFAFVQNLNTPDTDHYARAMRVVEAIKQSANPMALPIRWQDSESIHQDALEREIILQDDQPPEVIMAAEQRWMLLAQQAQMKMGVTAPMPGPGGPPGPDGQPAQMSPGQQPMLGSSPPIAAGAMSVIGGDSTGNAEAKSFDARSAA